MREPVDESPVPPLITNEQTLIGQPTTIEYVLPIPPLFDEPTVVKIGQRLQRVPTVVLECWCDNTNKLVSS